MIITWTKEIFAKVISDLYHIDWRSTRTKVALKTALATPTAVLIAWGFNITNPFWAGISALVVVQSFSGATIVRAFDRITATIVAAILAILVFILFNQNMFLYLTSTTLIIAVALYYSRKTDKLYAWLLGPATFLLIIFSIPPMLPYEASNEAYYRILEVIIGSSCAVVYSLFFPIHSFPIVKKNNLEMASILQSLYFANLDRYQFNTDFSDFQQQLDKLSNLADAQTVLRRSVQQEALLNLSQSRQTQVIEQMVHTLYEIIADSYHRYQPELAGLSALFAEPVAKLRQIAHTTFQQLDLLLDNQISLEQFQHHIALLHQATAQLIHAYEEVREIDRFVGFDVKTINQWQQFIASQQNIVQILQNFYHYYQQPKFSLSWQERFNNLFSFDRLYWLFGIKSALLAVGLTFVAALLNLPGVAMIGVVIILVAQLDVNLSKKLNYFSILAFAIGSLLAMIILAFSITNLAIYLLAFALCIFLTSYFIFVDLSYNYFGALASVAFIVSVVSGTGPVTDWRPSILLSISTIAALIIYACIDIWVWPVKLKDLLRHYELQLTRYSKIIENQLYTFLHYHHHPDYQTRLFLRFELNAMRQNIKALQTVQVPPLLAEQLSQLHSNWYHYYFTLSNLMLALAQLKIPAELEQTLPTISFAKIILNAETATAELIETAAKIQDWKNRLRAKALQGDPLVPTIPLLGAINTLSLLQELIREKNAVRQYSHSVLQNMQKS